MPSLNPPTAFNPATVDPAEFLARSRFTCETWTRLPSGDKLDYAGTFVMQGRTFQEGARGLNTYYDEWTTAEYNRLVHNGSVLARRVDAYCLAQAIAKQDAKNNVIPLRRQSKRAGDAAPSEDKSAWGFLALLVVGFGVMEGLKVWSGSYREQERLPGSRIARRNPSEDVRAWPARDRIEIYTPLAERADTEAWQASKHLTTYERALLHERASFALKDLAKAYADSGRDSAAVGLRDKGRKHMQAYAALLAEHDRTGR